MTEKRPTVGRPPTGTTPQRYFRMSDEEYAAVKEAAEQRNQTFSAFVREALLERIRSMLW